MALRGYFAAQFGIYLPTTNLHGVTTSIKSRLQTVISQFLYIFGEGASGNECKRTWDGRITSKSNINLGTVYKKIRKPGFEHKSSCGLNISNVHGYLKDKFKVLCFVDRPS